MKRFFWSWWEQRQAEPGAAPDRPRERRFFELHCLSRVSRLVSFMFGGKRALLHEKGSTHVYPHLLHCCRCPICECGGEPGAVAASRRPAGRDEEARLPCRAVEGRGLDGVRPRPAADVQGDRGRPG